MYLSENKAKEIFNLWIKWGGPKNPSGAALRYMLKNSGYVVTCIGRKNISQTNIYRLLRVVKNTTTTILTEKNA